jgi:hypothetical protein
MARAARTRPQTWQKMLMPHAQYEALKARRSVGHERGVNSDELTVKDNNDNDNAEEAEDPQGDLALVKTRIREDTINMFKRVLLFSQGAVVALNDNQMITTLDVLGDLTNNIIKEFCRAIKKPGGDVPGHQISELSVTCLKLFAFWARHMWGTSRGVDDWTETTWDDIKTLTNQKTLKKESLLDTKQPETLTMTLDPQLAAEAFTDVLILLSKMQGIAGHPLNYVLHSNLKEPNDADIGNETKDTRLLDNQGAIISYLTMSFAFGPRYCFLT